MLFAVVHYLCYFFSCHHKSYFWHKNNDGSLMKKYVIHRMLTDNLNPAKRKAMAVKNEKRFLKQKRNALKNPGYSRHPVKTQASFKRLLKAV